MRTALTNTSLSPIDPSFQAFLTARRSELAASISQNAIAQVMSCQAQPPEQIVQDIESLLEASIAALSHTDALPPWIQTQREHHTCWAALSRQSLIVFIAVYRQALLEVALLALSEGVAGASVGLQKLMLISDILLDVLSQDHSAESHMFEMLVKHAIDGVLVLSLDGEILHANPAAARLFGLSEPSELEHHAFAQWMSSADALSLTKEIYPVLQSQGYWQGYTWNQQSDGKSWRAFNSAFVLRDEQQEIIAQCFFIRDTTAEYEAEQAYQQQAERLTLFEALVENANDGVVVSDLVGNLQYLNPSVVRMNGMPSKEEYLKADLSKLLDPEELVRVATEVMPAVQRNGQWQGYIWGLRPDGTHWRGFNSVFLLADDHGKPLLQCSIVRDVTAEFEAEQERADLQEQVIQAQKAALRELSTPLIPLADGVLVMPLVGTVDSQRAQEVLETLLEGVSSNRANIAIIDITGVKVVDTQVANALLRTAQAARLLGSQVVLTGISPEVAQTLIGMGADLQGIVTRGTLQSGIKFALQEA